MPIGHTIPYLSTLVTLLFTVAVFRRWYARRSPYLLLWGVGLALYGIGTATEVVLGLTWSPLALRLWYISGAMLTAAWLGQGTIFLLVRRRSLAMGSLGLLLAGTVLAWALLTLTPIPANVEVVNDPVRPVPAELKAGDPAPATGMYNLAQPISGQYKSLMARSGLLTATTVVLNVYGTLGLVGGALYSGYLFWRKRVLANRVMGNVLIAAGALSPALGGTFVKAGLPDWLYVSELVGAILMFAGFLVAVSPAPAGRAAEDGVAPHGLPRPS